MLAKQAQDSTRATRVCLRTWPKGASWKLEESVLSPVTVMSLDCNLSGSCSASFCLDSPLSDFVVSGELAGSSLGLGSPVLSCPAFVSWPWRYQHWSVFSQTDWHVGLKTVSFAILHAIWRIAWYLQSTRQFFLIAKGLQILFRAKKGLHRWENFINMNSVSLPM